MNRIPEKRSLLPGIRDAINARVEQERMQKVLEKAANFVPDEAKKTPAKKRKAMTNQKLDGQPSGKKVKETVAYFFGCIF